MMWLQGFLSPTALEDREIGTRPFAEGIVARTEPYLYTSRGGRLRFKLKSEDLA